MGADPMSGMRLEGVIQRITHQNPDSGFVVFRLGIASGAETQKVAGTNRAIAVRGVSAPLRVGMRVAASGEVTNSPRFGDQFVAREIEIIAPDLDDADGMVEYLGSGVVPGITQTMGRRIADAFGAESVQVLDDPEGWRHLVEIKGINEQKARHLQERWKDHRQEFVRLKGLKDLGLGNADAVAVLRSDIPMERLRANPYLLTRVRGIGFLKADEVAQRLGIGGDNRFRVVSGVLHTLGEACANEGHTGLPRADLTKRCADMLALPDTSVERVLEELIAHSNSPIVEADGQDLLVPVHLHRAELAIVERLRAIMEFRTDWVEHQHRLPEGLQASASQAEALERFGRSKVLVLTGGPGTGKTTITRAALSMLDAFGVQKNRVAVLSPTGKAADRAATVTGYEGRTIHKALECGPDGFGRDATNPLDADAVVIDEASMADTELFSALLEAVPNEAIVLIVGDRDQLPSVGPGSVLRDLIESGVVPVSELKEVHRQSAGSRIIQVAKALNRGARPDLSMREGGSTDFHFVRCADDQIGDRVVELMTGKLQAYAKHHGFDPADIQVLTPQRPGPAGVVALNARLQEAINPADPGKLEVRYGEQVYRHGDRVLQTRNNYDLGVWNGETGRITAIDTRSGAMEVLFGSGGKARSVSVPRAALGDLDLAYAMTIHKSQGSEYPCVVLVAARAHTYMLERTLVYTGLTRTRKLGVAIGSPAAFQRSATRNAAKGRYTQLQGLLNPERLTEIESAQEQNVSRQERLDEHDRFEQADVEETLIGGTHADREEGEGPSHADWRAILLEL